MAGFKTHVTTSSLLGVGYAGLGMYHGLSIESSMIAGGLCGLSGMLPDIDSQSGIPLRETMGFAAAVVPMLMVDRFVELGLNYEQMVLAAGATYLFVRFAVTRLLSRYTVHRGMFHSIPALLIFTGLAFLISGSSNLQLRYFKAGGVFLGVLSHLLLDEFYSVEWSGGRWRFKKSFGTALKLWSGSTLGNMSAYGKLAVVVTLILSEPAIMERYGAISPVIAETAVLRDRLRARVEHSRQPPTLQARAGEATGLALAAPGDSGSSDPWARGIGDLGDLASDPYQVGPVPHALAATGDQTEGLPRRDRTIYDTARRIWKRIAE